MTAPLQLVSDDQTVELSVAEAAVRFGVSPTTIRRRLNEEPSPDGRRRPTALPNAHQDESGKWKIPVADLEAAQFKPGLQGRPPASRDAIQVSASEGFRGELVEFRQRVLAAESIATEAQRQLTKRLAQKDETIRTVRATVETQNATILALTRELEQKANRLALMEKRVKEPEGGTPPGSAREAPLEASGVDPDLEPNELVPVGELRRRLADRQPPPRHWWQRIGKA